MKIIIFLILTASFLFSKEIFAQWFWQNPQPQGHDLTSVQFINYNTGFAVGISGAFIKTTNGGLSWDRKTVNSGFDLRSVYFINPTTGFAVQYATTILKTTNAGENWSNALVYSGAYFNTVYFVDNNVGFACGCDNNIFKTTNCGVNWSQISMPGYVCVNSIHFPNINTGYILGNYSGKSYLFKTTNSGSNWAPLSFATKKVYNAIYFVNSDTGYAGGEGNQMAKTTSGGMDWTIISLPGGSQNIIRALCFSNQNYGFCISNDSTTSKIIRTTNAGNNWTLSYADSGFFATSISIKNGIGVAVANYGRIFRTTNNGDNWVSNNNGLSRGIGYLKFQNELTGFTVYNTYNGLYKSITTNGGLSWVPFGNGINAKYIFDIFFPSNNTGYAVGGLSNSLSRIYKTSDAGSTWVQQPFPDPRTIATVCFLDDNFGMAAGMQGLIIKTTNGGTNWSIVNTGGPEWIDKIVLTDYNTGYVCNSGGYILKSTNGGSSWFQAAYINGTSINDISFINNYTGYAAYAGSGGGVYKTTNGGLNWQNVFNGGSAPSIKFFNENTGFVSVYNGKIYSTTNGGALWSDQSGLTTFTAGCFTFISPQIAYAEAGGCLLKTTNVGFVFTEKKPLQTPKDFFLYQNYPNPFNPTTNIKFQISKIGFVRLKIYNSLGIEIKTLVNEKLGPGTYEALFNGNGLSSGIYFYKLETENFTDVKKLVLIK